MHSMQCVVVTATTTTILQLSGFCLVVMLKFINCVVTQHFSGNNFANISEVTLCQAQLVLRWMIADMLS